MGGAPKLLIKLDGATLGLGPIHARSLFLSHLQSDHHVLHNGKKKVVKTPSFRVSEGALGPLPHLALESNDISPISYRPHAVRPRRFPPIDYPTF